MRRELIARRARGAARAAQRRPSPADVVRKVERDLDLDEARIARSAVRARGDDRADDAGRVGLRARDADRAGRAACSTRGTPSRGSAATRAGGSRARAILGPERGAARAGRRRPAATSAAACAPSSVLTVIGSLAEPPADAHDAYLRLHLLSHRLIRPHEAEPDRAVRRAPQRRLDRATARSTRPRSTAVRMRFRAAGEPFAVTSIDKFPRMTDYVAPAGVRIADADRVRLGAHLAEGTTVMHEGFVNFNAGTLGASMVEGRISAGVVVGDGSDIGGGASIMGTLSGGGTAVISIGERCLLGANAGLGISLGDDCVVEAGLYVTAGSRVTLPDGEVVKAAELSGADGLLFRRNSQTGAIEALPRSGRWGGPQRGAARQR